MYRLTVANLITFALFALCRIGQAEPPTRRWADSLVSEERRHRAFASLTRCKLEGARIAVELLDHSSQRVIDQAAQLFMECGTDGASMVPELIEKLGSSRPDVSYAAMECLIHLVQEGAWLEVRRGVVGKLAEMTGNNRIRTLNVIGALGPRGSMLVHEVVAVLESSKDSETLRIVGMTLGDLGRVAVDETVRVLEGSNTSRAVACLAALGRMGPRAQHGLKAVLSAAATSDVAVRRASAQAIGEIGYRTGVVQETLTTLLEDEDRKVRVNAAVACIEIGLVDDESWACVVRVLRADTTPWDRVGVLRCIGEARFRGNRVLSLVLSWADDSDPEVRAIALTALSATTDSAQVLVGALSRRLRDPVAQVRKTAIELLGDLQGGQQGVADLILDSTQCDDEVTVVYAIRALAHCGGQGRARVTNRLTHLRDSGPALARVEAARALWMLTGEASENSSVLLRAWSDGEPDIRGAAARALCDVGALGAAIRKALKDGLAAEEWHDRQACVEILWLNNETLDVLLPVLRDGVIRLTGSPRRDLAQRIGRICRQVSHSVEVWSGAVDDPNWRWREFAARVLGKLDPADPRCRGLLLRLSRDGDCSVRRAATRSLERLAVLDED